MLVFFRVTQTNASQGKKDVTSNIKKDRKQEGVNRIQVKLLGMQPGGRMAVQCMQA